MYSPAQINAAGPPGAAGAVNGAGQAVSALMRAIGPTIGGFSWSASISLHMPGQQYLVRTKVLPFMGDSTRHLPGFALQCERAVLIHTVWLWVSHPTSC